MLDPSAPSVHDVASRGKALYTPEESVIRLGKMMGVCQKLEVDALLLIAGVDSRDSIPTAQALSYLFFGAAGGDLYDPELPETMAETFAIVYKGGAHVYTTPDNGWYVAHITSLWPNCVVHSLNDVTFADQQAFENDKVEAMQRLTGEFASFGVPVDGKVATVEKWPLVQAFAIDENGGRTFFTRAKRVVDASTALRQVYAEMDAAMMLHLATSSLPMLEYQWAMVLKTADRLRPSMHSDTADWSRELCEGLALYFEYSSRGTATSIPPPSQHFDGHLWSADVSDPASPLRFARTYFLTSGSVEQVALAAGIRALCGAVAEPQPDQWKQSVIARFDASLCDSIDVSVTACPNSVYFDGASSSSLMFAAISIRRGRHNLRYGDTILVTSSTCVNLTAPIVQIDMWETAPSKFAAADTALEEAEAVVQKREGGADEWLPYEGVLAFFECADDLAHGLQSLQKVVATPEGIVLVHRRYGVVGPISVASFAGLTVHDSGTLEDPFVASVSFEAGALPFGVGMSDVRLIVAFRSAVSARLKFLTELLPQWKTVLGDRCGNEAAFISTNPNYKLFVHDCAKRKNKSFRLGPVDSTAKYEDPESKLRADRVASFDDIAVRFPTAALLAAIRSHRLSDAVAVGATLGVETQFAGAPLDAQGIEVHAIAGLPGSGKHKLVEFARRALESAAAKYRDMNKAFAIRVVVSDVADATTFVTSRVEHQLSAIIAETTVARTVVLYVVPGFATMPDVVRTFADISVKYPRVALCSTTTVVNADLFYQDMATKPPFHVADHLLSQLVPGFTYQVLISTPSTKLSHATQPLVPRMVRFLADMSASLPFHVAYTFEEALRTIGLFDGDSAAVHTRFNSAEAQYARAACIGGLCSRRLMKGGRPRTLVLQYSEMTVTEPLVMDFLSSVVSAKASGSPLAGVYRFKGNLHVDGQTVEVNAVNGQPALTRYKVRRTDEVVRRDQQFVFIGKNLDPEAVSRYVTQRVRFSGSLLKDMEGPSARISFSGKRPLLTRDMLVAEDLYKIAADAWELPLPEHWRHDGVHYVHRETGETRDIRPDVEDLAAAFIARKNKEIREENEGEGDGHAHAGSSPSRESVNSAT